jgi:DNA primase
VRTSDDIVERVRDATSIVDVVSEHVRLRKRGRNYLGLCPFHTEKTPSFNVLEDKGIYKCFGCGEAGDVYSFVMKIEGMTFPEALEKLAKHANIAYERSAFKGGGEEDKNEPVFNACRDYAAYAYRALRGEHGKTAWEYLKNRGFSEETLKKFGVGFAPDGNAYYREIQEKREDLMPEQLAGIVAKSEKGDLYDRFRARVIFPIFSPTGRIIGFGGRILPALSEGTQLAKYINSPETSIYHKSQVLYGLFQAKESIRKLDYALLVEGYADVIALHQAGFENAIAASGTSLTSEQLNVLRRMTKNIVLLFDADLAGKNAALRGIELALAADFDVTTIILPAGEDPDSFIAKEGPEKFQQMLEHRTPFIETKAQILLEQGAFASPESSARAIRSLIETIAKIPDAIKQELFIRRLSEKYKLSETMLMGELQKFTKRDRRDFVKERIRQEERTPQTKPSSAVLAEQPLTKAEQALLRMFLEDTKTTYETVIQMDFDLSLVENDLVSTLIRHCISHYEDRGENESIGAIIETYRDDTSAVKLITDTVAEDFKLSSEWAGHPDDPLDRTRMTVRHVSASITAESLTHKRTELMKALSRPSEQNEYEKMLTQIADYSRKITELKNLSVVE